MARHLAQTNLSRALRYNIPQPSDVVYQPGDKVLLWHENLVENRIGGWVGLHTVCSFDEKSRTVLVQKTADSAHGRYSIIQVKPF